MKRAKPPVDFATATYAELDDYGMGMLVYDSAELSSILRGHLLIERILETLIANSLKRPDRILEKHRLTFELKVDLASALGALPDSHLGAAKALNGIRNAYAHNESHQLTLNELNSLKLKWEPVQDEAYAVACKKGVAEAAKLSIIFLHWSFLNLLPQAKSRHAEA